MWEITVCLDRVLNRKEIAHKKHFLEKTCPVFSKSHTIIISVFGGPCVMDWRLGLGFHTKMSLLVVSVLLCSILFWAHFFLSCLKCFVHISCLCNVGHGSKYNCHEIQARTKTQNIRFNRLKYWATMWWFFNNKVFFFFYCVTILSYYSFTVMSVLIQWKRN